MEQIKLIYFDNSTGVRYDKEFSALRVNGFDPIDSLFHYPDILHKNVQGDLLPRNIGFKREFTIEIGVTNYTNRLFCANFFYSSTKWIQYSHDGYFESVQVVNTEGTVDTEWLNNIHLARYIRLNLQDKLLLRNFPVQVTSPTSEDNMYFNEKVLIDGYQGNEETFTTGSGKLATCQAPAGAFPYFDSSLQKFHISIDGSVYQDCHFNLTDIPTTSGGALTFKVARSDSGNPSTDGSYYANISIFVQSIL